MTKVRGIDLITVNFRVIVRGNSKKLKNSYLIFICNVKNRLTLEELLGVAGHKIKRKR